MISKSNAIPKVSIIIPVYNAQEYLQECLNSVLNQTFSDIEVVLVDDGSKDDSGKICDEYALKDSRIKVIHQQNAGVSAARNKGIESATGDWLMFVDSDDAVVRDAVEKLLAQADEFVQVVVARRAVENDEYTGEVTSFDLEKYRNDFYGACIAGPDMFSPIYPEEMRKLPYIGTPWGKLFDRKLIVDNNIKFPTEIRFGEDSVFNIDVLKVSSKVCYVDSAVYIYRVHEGSISTGNIDKKFDEYLAYVQKTERVLETLDVKDSLCQYRSVDLSQMIWELANLYGSSSRSLKKIIEYSKKLREFAENPPCKEALLQVKCEWLPETKHKLMVVFLKMRLYTLSVFICSLFSMLFSGKN